MDCKDIEFIPVDFENDDGKLLFATEAINYTLEKIGEKEFVRVTEYNDHPYIVVKK